MDNKHTRLTENQVFENMGLADSTPLQGVYEDCRFIHCNFSHSNLSGATFRNCSFEGCDISMASLQNTGLQEIGFFRCKLLGVQFSDCRKFMLELLFEECQLKLSGFFMLNLKNTRFTTCDLQEADFTGSDLSGAAFENCDLHRAIFHHTNLEKSDFRSAINYSINPETNRIRKARFSLPAVTGLLDTWDITIE